MTPNPLVRQAAEELTRPGPDPPDPGWELPVLSVDERLVTLPRRARSDRPGVWALRWDGGCACSDGLARLDDHRVVRHVRPGRGGLRPGLRVRMDREVYADPGALGSAFRETAFPSELGPLPAWEVDGSAPDWAVMIHGRGADRREPLRALRAIVGRGMPALVVAYRGDPEAPPIPDGLARLGAAEWRDVEAAIAFALGRGARRVVLVGFSLGGGMALSAARRSRLRHAVAGVVLEAPFIDLGTTLRRAGSRRGSPPDLIPAAMRAVEEVAGIDLDEIDHLRAADRLDVPILLIHADADVSVPVASSDALARARPDLVALHRVAGAGHLEAWNVDPRAYLAQVDAFLDRLGAGIRS